jgi:Membrane domain of glycerophosphoryl diester phosphodiesterase
MSQKLQNHLANGYDFKIGDYLSRGMEIFKANMGGYIGYSVLYFLIAFVCGVIPFVNMVSPFIITPCLAFGFHLVSNQISEKNKIPEFGTFFNGFSHLSKLAVITLITLLCIGVCFLPFLFSVGFAFLSNLDNKSEMLSTIMSGPMPLLIIGFLALLYLSISWTFSSLIAVFHNKEAWSAMETSRKLVGKNWLMVLLFIIVIGLINLLGLLILGFGLLFTVPYGICCLYAAYEDIAGLDNNSQSQIDEIGQIGTELK